MPKNHLFSCSKSQVGSEKTTYVFLSLLCIHNPPSNNISYKKLDYFTIISMLPSHWDLKQATEGLGWKKKKQPAD